LDTIGAPAEKERGTTSMQRWRRKQAREHAMIGDKALGMRRIWGTVALLAAIVALQALQPTQANDKLTRATLLDRVQIEDMLTAYYWDMTSDARRGLADHYLEDGVLEVNGIVLEGREAIKGFLNQEMPLGPQGSTYDLILTNPRIRIDGNTATVDTMWSGIVSENVKDPPKLVEQGREHTELVKQKGRWYIKKRVVKSLAGLPEMPGN
jgi:hypothetical protein